MEFAGLRPYQPGDDLRNMDWRHTARRGRPFTKLFHEERERPVLLFVDLGPTMQFGTRAAFKSVIAARAAALLAWATIAADDRVGGVVWNGLTHRNLRPRAREAGALDLLGAIVHLGEALSVGREATTAQGLAQGLRALGGAIHPGTLVVVISDFRALDADAERELLRLRNVATLTLIRVYDVREAEPPPAGIYPVTDGVHERVLDLGDPLARSAYGASFRALGTRLAALAGRLDAPLIPLQTDADPLPVLGALGRAPVARHPLTLG